jgi:hypothetical protein
MSERDLDMPLRQSIENAFRDIEGLLAQVEEINLASRSHSPFNDYLRQLSPEQHKIVDHGISELRTAMICILRHFGIIGNNPHINTARAVRTTLTAAAAQFEQLNRKTEVIDDDFLRSGQENARLLQQMKGAFVQMDHCLSESETTLEKR